MKEGWRQSMAWLHTWSGLLVGWVLFMVFLAGTLAYYRAEITLWMKPESHVATLGLPAQADLAARALATLEKKAAGSNRWIIGLPDGREPTVRIFWNPPVREGEAPQRGGRRRFESADLDPATGEPLPAARATRGGDFFYRLHFDLHYMPVLWARWIVCFCAMFMLVAIVSGVITHKRIFADFFTFRPKKGQRSWLDAHNATAVLALPYHLMITYTGLVTLMFMVMPWGIQAQYKEQNGSAAFFNEIFGREDRNARPSGTAAPLAPIAPMLAQLSERWNGAQAGSVTVANPGDAGARVTITRGSGDAMTSRNPSMVFDGATGRLLAVNGDNAGGAAATQGVMVGLHEARFAHPLLRALFFLSGLAGCAMVATGALLWAVKERQKHARVLARGGRAGFGLRLVDGLNIGAIAGLPIAVAVYFWANRLLPLGIGQRAQAEIDTFFAAWAIAALAAQVRPDRAMWRSQLWTAAVLIALLPVLNGLTGGAHLGVTLVHGPGPVAGFDLVALALGALLGYAAWKLGRKPAGKPRTAPAAEPVLPATAAARTS
ncbi:PepSY-associated TM helix domain-containing protein [Xylophilus sp.]|uniref:PepSY-associated TM helix domain-containing protein n=1 Tax=Xylophilus sp. TaxID=2653893 RepID=UPI0013B72A29|nr:PepSY-associated TM helix domain-containing protein [Xylophilus sp.]KAF1048253.1 MAG: hypothetical protein GAK38_01502 [Xylophilus sp.]